MNSNKNNHYINNSKNDIKSSIMINAWRLDEIDKVIQEGGYTYYGKIERIVNTTPPQWVQYGLSLSPKSSVINLVRTNYANNLPVNVQSCYFSKKISSDIKTLPDHYLLALESFNEQRGMMISSADELYFADFPSLWIKTLLELGENKPVLVCKSVRYINDYDAIMCVETWNHPERNMFSRHLNI